MKRRISILSAIVLILLAAGGLLWLHCSGKEGGPSEIVENSSYGCSFNSPGPRLRRVLLLAGTPDPLSRRAAKYTAEELRRIVPADVRVEYRDPFTASAPQERLADTLTLLVSAAEPVEAAAAENADRLSFRCDAAFRNYGGFVFRNWKGLSYSSGDGHYPFKTVTVSVPPGARTAAIRLAARKLAGECRRTVSGTMDRYRMPELLYSHLAAPEGFPEIPGGILLQRGTAPDLRCMELWYVPAGNDPAARRDELLAFLQRQGFEPREPERRYLPETGELTAIPLRGGDRFSGALITPLPFPEQWQGRATLRPPACFLLYLMERESAVPAPETVRRLRLQHPLAFLQLNGVRSASEQELPECFDRILALPELTLDDRLLLYSHSERKSPSPAIIDRRQRLLASIIDRIAAKQGNPSQFSSDVSSLLSTLQFNRRTTPEQEKQLGRLASLLLKIDEKELCPEGRTFFVPISGRPCVALLIPVPQTVGQYCLVIAPEQDVVYPKVAFRHQNFDQRGFEWGGSSGVKSEFGIDSTASQYALRVEWTRHSERGQYEIRIAYTPPDAGKKGN